MGHDDRRDTNIRSGKSSKVAGHASKERRIRHKDGLLSRGKEIGSVDSQGKIRRKDGFLMRGEVVGKVSGTEARAKDGIIFEGQKWGYVDPKGNVRQRDGALFKGRIVGSVKGDPTSALGYFVLKFQGIVDKVDTLEKEIRGDSRKGRYLARVQKMLVWVPKADALGDFDGLIRRLKQLEQICKKELDDNYRQKERLVSQARSLTNSSEWKATAEKLKDLQKQWKAVGPTYQEKQEVQWQAFREAIDKFFDRRKRHFETLNKEREANYAKKEQLISRALSYANSTDWKETGQKLKRLQQDWKSIGPVPREKQDAQWKKFREAQDRFFDRRKRHFDALNKEREANYTKKEQLISKALSYASSTDWKETAEKLKGLQQNWKSIGPVPREKQDAQWRRFREAQDRFFDRRNRHFNELNKQREANAKARESLIRQAETLSRSSDFKETGQKMKDLQSQWKAIGPVPREVQDSQWNRFRAAQDHFYSRRTDYYDRRQAEWQAKMREALDRKREQADRLRDSIAHDQGNIDRWRDQIYSLRPGGRADEIQSSLESKIDSVGEKIRSKESRVADLESAIRDIRSKLS